MQQGRDSKRHGGAAINEDGLAQLHPAHGLGTLAGMCAFSSRTSP